MIVRGVKGFRHEVGYTSLSQKLTGRTNAGPNKRAKETTRGNKTNQTSEALIQAESTFSM